jgi:hypothetical protein
MLYADVNVVFLVACVILPLQVGVGIAIVCGKFISLS